MLVETFGKERLKTVENRKVMAVKRLHPKAQLPNRQTKGSAGYDLCACIEEPVSIAPGETVLFPTGIAAQIPRGTAGMIYTRSGLGIRHGIVVANGVGVIDSDYRGEIRVGLFNQGKEVYRVQPMERIAQLVIQPVCLPEIEETEELSQTERGAGGFGSTGSL